MSAAPEIVGAKVDVPQNKPRLSLIKNPLAVGALFLAAYMTLRGFVRIHDVMLIGFAGVVLAVLMSFPIEYLARFMRRGFAVFEIKFLKPQNKSARQFQHQFRLL